MLEIIYYVNSSSGNSPIRDDLLNIKKVSVLAKIHATV